MDKAGRSVKLINHFHLMRKLKIRRAVLPLPMSCKLFVVFNIYRSVHRNTGCPTRYRNQHFFNNFTTNEDIATKFEADLPHCVRNVKKSAAVQISLQNLHWC
jgi:hypothetical protein